MNHIIWYIGRKMQNSDIYRSENDFWKKLHISVNIRLSYIGQYMIQNIDRYMLTYSGSLWRYWRNTNAVTTIILPPSSVSRVFYSIPFSNESSKIFIRYFFTTTKKSNQHFVQVCAVKTHALPIESTGMIFCQSSAQKLSCWKHTKAKWIFKNQGWSILLWNSVKTD